jgi:hypothetical protein
LSKLLNIRNYQIFQNCHIFKNCPIYQNYQICLKLSIFFKITKFFQNYQFFIIFSKSIIQRNQLIYQIMDELIPYEHIARLCAIHRESHFHLWEKVKLFKNWWNRCPQGHLAKKLFNFIISLRTFQVSIHAYLEANWNFMVLCVVK